MIKLFVGLGNPGREYQNTRHNIGFMAIDRFNLSYTQKFKGDYSTQDFQGEKIYFLKPQTYMNLSGESVVALMNFFKITINEVLIVHDEIDLPFGSISLKKGGGLAGHNGLKSIAGLLGSQDFYRMRLGVGRPLFGQVSDFVLGEFSKDEKIQLDNYLNNAKKVIEDILKIGFEKASNLYSKKSLI